MLSLSRGTAVALAVLVAAAGCAAPRPQESLLHACDGYATALRIAAATAAGGHLTARQVQSIDEIRSVVTPICDAPPITDESAQVALGSVQRGLETLIFYYSQAGAAL